MSAGPRPLERTLIVDVWNVGQALGKGARLVWQLACLLRTADVIGLLEAARYTPALRRALGRWWIVYRAHHPGADRSSDVVVLVHRTRIPRPHITSIGHAIGWTGPKAAREHKGRSWPLLEWPNLDLVIIHKTPGGPSGGIATRGANRPAWMADQFVLRAFLNRPKPRAVLGDMNGKRGELDELEKVLGLEVTYTSTAVDHGATAGLDTAAWHVLPKAGSDHHRVRWFLGIPRRQTA